MNEQEQETTMTHQIRLTLERFDFTRVAKAMQAIGWVWKTHDGMRSPNELEIEKAAIELLSQVSEEWPSASSGGLTAELDEGELYLSFVLEASNSEVE